MRRGESGQRIDWMLAPWVIEETKDVDLQDKRLNDRLAVILNQLAGHPTASIPAACGGYAEMMAAYRFFDNDKVGFENVLQPDAIALATSSLTAPWDSISSSATPSSSHLDWLE